jgi:hypothetical protein
MVTELDSDFDRNLKEVRFLIFVKTFAVMQEGGLVLLTQLIQPSVELTIS